MKPRFISDIHLSQSNAELTNAFKRFLNESKSICTHLFILGDLFEVWIGDDDQSPYHQQIKKDLLNFTTKGPKTYFMHGNRDFLIGQKFAAETGIEILSDPHAMDINGLKTILSHGDFLCTDDVDYINFRNMVRSDEWKHDFLSKNLDERNTIANSLRDESKNATSEKSLVITDVSPNTLNTFLAKKNPDIFIHGHTHKPAIHDEDSSIRIVLGDWDEYGWYLTIDEKDYNLEKFKI